MAFWIDGDRQNPLRLKSFSSSGTSSGKSTIKITLETSDPWALGDALRGLAEVQRSQNDKQEPKRRLALPAPEEH
ncbi:hypothetical protein C8J27_11089 [Rhodobacter aestuarii]|uniref:Uncharacterized protein n=1 Tax=Rhodobacter aestuarii TaxID=453582 RepID=A0A1N7Q209_9RHOB|nr:hypothetical protein [Rhodobacter aestuarii]PTV94038.1 hypothetical protein C8J27_11089 [Rhodobacter aestuarii]SIT16872.1 hypothetical protein SAMN05421580_11289 [Rhodobacter aestuarii]